MTIVFDRAVALAGRFSVSLQRRSAWAPWAVVGGLLIGSLIPVLIVGSTKQPTDISLADLESQRIPALTSWFRLEGDLRAVSHDGLYIYTLHDPQDDRRAVTVVSEAPLVTGHADVTGRIASESAVAGTFQSIQADVPTEPARHDPWLLFSLPAILAIAVLAGFRVGYPVVRGDPAAGSRALPLRPDESVAARWSGRIGNERATLEQMRPCFIAVAQGVDVCHVTIDDAGTIRKVSVRRAAFRRRMRICWTSGCRPAVEMHGPSADLLLTFDKPAERDRLLASLA
jgi:hypothetical protein